MNFQELPLDFTEKITFRLRSLYEQYGYTQYKMSKFEEYDLYARNKDFLISEHVITFTDLGGKLMALKPDVTLSIVKNSRDSAALQKLYYNENVYRVAKGTHTFRQIQQVGLECLGNTDDYCLLEVLQLAAQSLSRISKDCILDISSLGLWSQLTDRFGIGAQQKEAFFRCIGGKNSHELAEICRSAGVSEGNTALLTQLAAVSGEPETVLPQLKTQLRGIVELSALEQLERVTALLKNSAEDCVIHIDLSVVDDVHYYNGIVFKGFVRGLPGSVLSGGQYDKLMRKMNRRSGAIGFAVYMDMLERLECQEQDYDVDTVVLYDAATPLAAIQQQAKILADAGLRFMLQQQVPCNIRYRRLLKIGEGEAESLEYNA